MRYLPDKFLAYIQNINIKSWWYLSAAWISLGQQKRCRGKDHAAWNAVKYSNIFTEMENIAPSWPIFLVFLLKITKTLHTGQCGGKSYTATCLFASRDFTMRGQKKHINESFSQSLSENWESKQWPGQTSDEHF